MADSDRSDARSTSRLLILATVLIFVVLGGIVTVRGCHEPNDREDIINPDDPLPGARDATGSRYVPDAEPLLA